jgi:precorrin-6B methylase 2
MRHLLSSGLFVSTLAGALLVASPGMAQDKKPTRGPDCVYVPTPYDVVEKMLEMAKVKKSDIVWDLGCGDGRIVVEAAKKAGCKAVGFDIEPNRVKEARANAKKNKVEHLVQIKQEDIFTLDLSEPTVLCLYILPSMMTKLKPQMAKLQPGTRIVAHDYPITTAQEEKRITMISNETNEKHTLYLYTVPLKPKNGNDDTE